MRAKTLQAEYTEISLRNTENLGYPKFQSSMAVGEPSFITFLGESQIMRGVTFLGYEKKVTYHESEQINDETGREDR